ncbi:MarR family transcriptional regulator [Fulvivirga maritima]|uniref:MarR family winged helix-turn-helix transcriptional regulator n=1 Tax=Fulvivirga maritima TaxID=2904247 RepID=UPI001F33602E|nr:MarR family transcriptional regulator [Fulvivirga maritima]UII24483.1 MarR family transcriptional regulator [Fulvivirga maritima]
MDSLEILINIRKIVRALSIESKIMEKEYGLSIPQFLCLSYLEKSPGYHRSQKELKEQLNLNSSTVTGIINRLEKRGYVARMPKSGDKRITHITLTALGIKLLENAPNVLHDKLSKKLETLSTEEIEMVNKSLEIITNAMQIKEMENIHPFISEEDHPEL